MRRPWVIDSLIYVKDNFDEKIFKTNIGNFTKDYSINDVLPYNSVTDGSIQMNLYNGIFTQSKWEERLKYNNAPVMTNINEAIIGSLKTEFIDVQSDVQYFQNSLSDVRLVLFGHTHRPMIKSYTNTKNEACLYANSGSWEDQKTRDKTANIDQDTKQMYFLVIAPVESNRKNLQVLLYQYRYGKHSLKERKQISL